MSDLPQCAFNDGCCVAEAYAKGRADMLSEAAGILLEGVLLALDGDGHVYGTRPCATCQLVSSIRQKPFGCIRVAQSRAKGKP